MSFKRSAYEKKKLKKLCKCHGCAYFNEDKNRYIRFSISDEGASGSHRVKYLKKIARRKARRSNSFGNYGNFKKAYDLKWEID